MKIIIISTLVICIMLTGCNSMLFNNRSSYSERLNKKENLDRDIAFECRAEDRTIKGSIRMPYNFKNSKKYAAVVISHGIFADRNQYGVFTKLTDTLEKCEFVSVRFDFDGYGESDGSLDNNSIKTECEDLRAVINYVSSLEYIDNKKINLIGYSMGGAVASVEAGQMTDKIRSTVLWAPAAVIKDDCEIGQKILDSLDYYGISEEENNKRDRFILGDAFFEDADSLDIYREAVKYTGPVLIIQGNKDVIVPVGYAEKYNELYSNSELVILEGVGHILIAEPLEQAISLTTEFLEREN